MRPLRPTSCLTGTPPRRSGSRPPRTWPDSSRPRCRSFRPRLDRGRFGWTQMRKSGRSAGCLAPLVLHGRCSGIQCPVSPGSTRSSGRRLTDQGALDSRIKHVTLVVLGVEAAGCQSRKTSRPKRNSLVWRGRMRDDRDALHSLVERTGLDDVRHDGMLKVGLVFGELSDPFLSPLGRASCTADPETGFEELERDLGPDKAGDGIV